MSTPTRAQRCNTASAVSQRCWCSGAERSRSKLSAQFRNGTLLIKSFLISIDARMFRTEHGQDNIRSAISSYIIETQLFVPARPYNVTTYISFCHNHKRSNIMKNVIRKTLAVAALAAVAVTIGSAQVAPE